MSARPFDAVTLVPGAASGPILRLDEPLSFWGGLDSATGAIIDRLHPQQDANIAGRMLMMPTGRGSSSQRHACRGPTARQWAGGDSDAAA
jgi:uncharacterized protein